MPYDASAIWTWSRGTLDDLMGRGTTVVETEPRQVVQSNGRRRLPHARDASSEAVLQTFASMSQEEAIDHLQTVPEGLTDEEAERRLKIGGFNLLSTKKPPTWWQLLLSVLPNPFNILLTFLAVISVATPPPNWPTFTILVIMIVVSCALRFWQEYRSSVAAVKLQEGVTTDVRVRRRTGESTSLEYLEMVIDEKHLVPGDILLVDPGDRVPADCLVLEALNLQISQSSLTGESESLKKTGFVNSEIAGVGLFDRVNLLFMGTSVISGSGTALVLRTGDDAFIATIVKQLNKNRPLNSFQRGIRNVVYLMIAFMLVMVPIVLVISGKVTGNWSQSALFSVSVAVGLVPEMLPAIVNANLARGAFKLSKKKAIVKRLDAIQNLGAMSVLCSDKTGTLTKDKITLCHHVTASGAEDHKVLQLAYVNAINQGGKKNSIDSAIIEAGSNLEKPDRYALGRKVAEISFNFETRRSSAIIKTQGEKLLLICKGAFEEVSAICTHARVNSKVVRLDGCFRQELYQKASAFNDEGYRVIMVATTELLESDLDDEDTFDGLDANMVVEGLLTFLDPPKDDAAASVARLEGLGVDVKVLTGDNLGVALKVCRTLNLVKEVNEGEIQAITGPDLAKIENKEEFTRVVTSCKIFAKLMPSQKGQVIMGLKAAGEAVGMLGDGINDCIALRFADVGISVDSGANVAKDCADVILTEKQLSIIVDSVTIGRITHGNTIKYIKMVASSNFGNVFSILAASAWLPFVPMTSLQILIQNLLYDISQIAIPWDNMDEEYIRIPRRWNAKDLLRFILILGPTSSTIDICTFSLGWFYYGIRTTHDPALVAEFHTHWFLEGLLTQTLIIHLLRTVKIPILQRRSAPALAVTTVTIMLVGLSIPYIPPFQKALALVRPANSFIGFLAAELLIYCVEVQIVKMVYVRVFRTWL